MDEKLFNVYYNGNDGSYVAKPQNLDSALDFAKAVLVLGGEITSIISVEDDN